MKLEKLTYTEFEALPGEWTLTDCTFGAINLVVGKNATGKTRMLNVLRGVAILISESNVLEIGEGKYSIELSHNNQTFVYSLEHHNKSVFFEELKIDNVVHLTRSEDGKGVIKALQIGQDIQFKTETNRLAVVAKRDSIQHPYIDDLYLWAQGIAKLDFGSSLGKDQLIIKPGELRNLGAETKLNIKDTDKVVGIFMQGEKDFGSEFKDAVLSDMRFIGYDIGDVGVDSFDDVSIVAPKFLSSLSINSPSGIYVTESDIKTRIIQLSMSQGMFRALSLFVQFNYGLLSKKITCLLIDDIGEGLDYSRSSTLVNRLIEKVEHSSMQLIMTTNDRFIMNAVPLDYWIILSRAGGAVVNLNYRNSKEMFDEFQNTGLNNFDLLTTGYYKRKEE